MSYNNEWIWSILNGLPQGSWERRRGGHQRHRNLANLVLISGPQTAFLHHLFAFFCSRNLFVPNRTLCLLDGMRWGWNLKLACLRTLLQGFYQTFGWFFFSLVTYFTYFHPTGSGIWHNIAVRIKTTFCTVNSSALPNIIFQIWFLLLLIFSSIRHWVGSGSFLFIVQRWFGLYK